MPKRNRNAWGVILAVTTIALVLMGSRHWYPPVAVTSPGPNRVSDPTTAAWQTVLRSPHTPFSLHGIGTLETHPAPHDSTFSDLEAYEPWSAPVAVCFAEGTPPDIMAAVNEAEHRDPNGGRYFLHGVWGGNPGNPVNLTWSFVPDDTIISPAGAWDNGGASGPSRLFQKMDEKFGGDRQLWISQFEDSFARWQELTGISYTRITYLGQEWDDGAPWGSPGGANRGDIRIASRNIDGQYNILAYNFFPGAGDMVLDQSENWGSTYEGYRFLRNVVMHEHGHGIGLEHVCPQLGSRLMEPGLNTSFDGPQHDDLRGAQQNYGDPFENNNNPAEATYLGTAVMGAPLILGSIPAPAIPNSSLLSMDFDDWETEEDWFRFTLTVPDTAVTVSVIPKGFYYDSAPQNGDGSCGWGDYEDSEAAGNLDVEIYDTDGTTMLRTSLVAPAGSTETIEDAILGDPGDYYVRVFPTGWMFGSQLYELELSARDPGACCLADGSCIVVHENNCALQAGFYTGDGVTCPPDPPCEPVATLMSCELGSTAIFPNGSVPLEVFVEEVDDLQTYQATIVITRTSGEGTLDVTCPGGVQVDTTRPDFVFADLPPGSMAIPGAQCASRQIAATILGGASVNVGSPRKYLGDLTLDLSGDATAGATFTVEILPVIAQSFLRDSLGYLIPTRLAPPCVVTVLDPEDVRAPVAEPGGSSCGDSSDCVGAYAGADCVGGTCYAAKNRYLSIDPTVNASPVAYHLELTEAADYPTAEGQAWWIDEPQCYDFPNGEIVVPPPSTCDGPDRFGWVSNLTSTLVERIWTETPLHITDCGVVPVATFEIRASEDGGETLSFALEINTAHRPEGETQSWGDITGGPVEGMPGLWLPPERTTNFADVGNAIRTFENRTEDTGFPPRVWVDMEINQVVNLADISFIVMAFEGREYADIDLPLIGVHPAACP